MAVAIIFQLKWSMILLLSAIILIKSDEPKSLYTNCSMYNNTDIYGGEICGTDGITYANKRYLWCLNGRDGVDIATAHPGCCLPGEQSCDRNYIYSPICGYDGKTWSNLESLRCHNFVYNTNIERNFEGICDDKCNLDTNKDPCTQHGFGRDGLNPVCASNGFTYQNVAQVKCLRKHSDPNLYVLYAGGCSVRRVLGIITDTKAICEISKTRFEWNPICGNDGKTYSNPFIYICVRREHKSHIRVSFRGECNTSAHKACLQLRSNKYTKGDRVCGNDGVTYDSIDHLRCLANRNKYLSFKHEGKCIGPNDNPCGVVSDEDCQHPICASNNVTYISIEAMWCVNRQNNTTWKYRHDGPCLHSE